MKPLYIGVDLGTSGCRAVALDGNGQLVGESRVSLPPPLRSGATVEQDPELWWEAVVAAMDALAHGCPLGASAALALDATSGTVLLLDGAGVPVSPGLMYNDHRASVAAQLIARFAPRESAAHGAASSLAKAFWLLAQRYDTAQRVATQADFIYGRLGATAVVDENNALKLGYDPLARRWPNWLQQLGLDPRLLPRVVAAGAPVGRLDPNLAARWGMASPPQLVAGSSDSTAAILATGVTAPGEAVTSLGSTLVTKVVSDSPVFAPEFGVYSQPYRGRWLVGGGSSSGGAVLRQFFSDAEIAQLSAEIDPQHPTDLDYYPLPGPGERFPIADPAMAPRLTPRPAEPSRFLQGLLEGISQIERLAYQRLTELGAPPPSTIYSVGGGAANPTWSAIRARLLAVPLATPAHQEAAYGSALLALAGAHTSPPLTLLAGGPPAATKGDLPH